jgi:hypothetical protein
MTTTLKQDEVVGMAVQAGLSNPLWIENDYAIIEAFAKLVEERTAAKQREAAEERVVELFTDMETPYLPDIVKAIRARGTNE